jgi:CMD domain protein
MLQADQDDVPEDVVEAIAGIVAGSGLQALRQQRAKVAAATQGSYLALLQPSLPGLALEDRLLVSLHSSLLSAAPELAAHYRERLLALQADARLVAAVERLAFHDVVPAGKGGAPQASPLVDTSAAEEPTAQEGTAVEEDVREADNADDAVEGAASDRLDRLRPVLSFARMLIEHPAAGSKAALQPLRDAGLGTAAVVALAQLVAFLSYQVRLIAGLKALKGAAAAEPAAMADIRASRGTRASPTLPAGGDSHTIRVGGFTNEALDWKAWLDVVDLEQASAEQITVLEESHPQAKVQDYYRLLVHQPEILRQRSAAFNAIMYAPRGLSRAERELGATVASRLNGCVYCASVHARRFEQMARRNQVIREVFENPQVAGDDDRERAVVRLSIDLTLGPDKVTPQDVDALAQAGLDNLEILDLIHSVAIFAWANRLMLTLGAPCAAATA